MGRPPGGRHSCMRSRTLHAHVKARGAKLVDHLARLSVCGRQRQTGRYARRQQRRAQGSSASMHAPPPSPCARTNQLLAIRADLQALQGLGQLVWCTIAAAACTVFLSAAPELPWGRPLRPGCCCCCRPLEHAGGPAAAANAAEGLLHGGGCKAGRASGGELAEAAAAEVPVDSRAADALTHYCADTELVAALGRRTRCQAGTVSTAAGLGWLQGALASRQAGECNDAGKCVCSLHGVFTGPLRRRPPARTRLAPPTARPAVIYIIWRPRAHRLFRQRVREQGPG